MNETPMATLNNLFKREPATTLLAASVFGFFAGRAYGRLARRRWLGARSWVDPRLSYGRPDADHVQIPRASATALTRLLFLRGLANNNTVLSSFAARLVCSLQQQLAGRYEPTTPKAVPRVDWRTLDVARFKREYLANPRPVVLTHVELDRSRWAAQGLIERHGDRQQLLTDLDSGVHELRPLSDLRRTDRRYYLHNSESLWSADPQLLDSLPLDSVGRLLDRTFSTAQAFVGLRGDVGTDLHCAHNFNAFFQMQGRKKWVLVNPHYTLLVYPLVSADASYMGSMIKYASAHERQRERFPLFDYCPRFETVVEEGELLLNPPCWWHAVEALSGATVSASCRMGDGSFSSVLGNKRFEVDFPEPNHLFTSLQLLSPRLMRLWYAETAARVRLKLDERDVPAHTTRLADGHTVFEHTSHDHLQRLVEGRALDAAWRT